MKTHYLIALILVALGLITASQAVFIVDETKQGVLLQLGQPIGETRGPGFHFKIPFIQQVRLFERRIIPVDPKPEQMVIASSRDNPLLRGANTKLIENEAVQNAEGEKGQSGPNANSIGVVSGEPIVVDAFARFMIVDPLRFLKSLRTLNAAQQRIENMVNDSTRAVLGQTTLGELLSEQRNDVMERIRQSVNDKVVSDQLGVEIVDVRIVRADLTPDLRQSTVQRMISELRERATETRAKGDEVALEIRSRAEKEREIILAEANRESQILRGQGDKIAIQIYGDAYNRDPDFFAFWRSLQAYDTSIADENTNLVVSPDSEFFRFFSPIPSSER